MSTLKLTPLPKKKHPLSRFFLTILFSSCALFLFCNLLYIEFIEEEKITMRKSREFFALLPFFKNYTLSFAFYGDSHVLDNVKTPLLPYSYNFGLGGSPYTLLLWQQRKLFEMGVVPIVSVYQVDPLTFSPKWRSIPYILYDVYFATQYIPPHILKDYTNLSLLTIHIKRFFPVLGEGKNVLLFLITKERKPLYMGWSPEKGNLSLHDARLVAKREVTAHLASSPNSFEEKTYTAFLRQVEEAASKGSLILLVTYPHSPPYRDYAQELGFNFSFFIGKIHDDLKEKNISFCYINYYAAINNTDLYADSNHLNAAGSDLFTRQFMRDVREAAFTHCHPPTYGQIMNASIHPILSS